MIRTRTIRRSIARALVLVGMSSIIAAAAQLPPGHADHSSRHGGHVVPAAGDTLHLEGLLLPERFKLFVDNVEGRPIPRERLNQISGQVLFGAQSAPLVLSTVADSFEARIPPMPWPAEMTLRIRLSPNEPEAGFLFIFGQYSDETAIVNFDLPPTKIAGTLFGILADLRNDRQEAQILVDSGTFGIVYAPAVRIRDRVLALEPYAAKLNGDARARAEAAMLSAVRAAWLLHTSGDVGYPLQRRVAFTTLSDALDEVATAFGEPIP